MCASRLHTCPIQGDRINSAIVTLCDVSTLCERSQGKFLLATVSGYRLTNHGRLVAVAVRVGSGSVLQVFPHGWQVGQVWWRHTLILFGILCDVLPVLRDVSFT